ncbi:gamma-glutamyltransferase [Thiomicrospira sp. WB1]|uniref:gamma-glutamyltransferase n=1 Tax=Thiomicrospira sp. WB1 TaxID=1685380 RepID=UPI00074A9845|nr:gamma-glutamyltransferase [Thiomicrospira sp. WB1]KUJ71862.1 gamma-glutamyltranspeptidase [Thiomicrospira sp. WB1]
MTGWTNLMRGVSMGVGLLLAINAQSAVSQTAVAMPDQHSAAVAQQILDEGGHAVDAAVAAAFTLAVTYPEAGNLGGGGFMTLFAAEKKGAQPQPWFLDYREKAPQAAVETMYLDKTGEVIPFRSLVGYQASGVPGTVKGMWAAHQRFGRLPWARLLQPAIELAQSGFIVPESLAQTADWYQGWLNKKLAPAGQPESVAKRFQQFAAPIQAGQRWQQPALAKTLTRLAELGESAFYQGPIADQLVSAMQAGGGLITHRDLADYDVRWRAPIRIDWLGYELVSAPPPSSGGVAIAQLLKMKQLRQADFEQAMQAGQSDPMALRTHFYAELAKRVYADRAEYLGDPDFVSVPTERLLSKSYLKSRSEGIDLRAISETESIQPGLAESTDTTHFSIVDAEGNAVSNTYTLNMPFGSGVVIEAAGFLMNNEMDDFSQKPGVPNVFGVIGGKANAIAPEKRMLSSMSPTLLLQSQEDGSTQVVAAVGTPGGSSIITSVFQTLVNVFEREMTAQQAVDATRVHHQLWPKNEIRYHPSLSESTQAELTLMGYQLKRHPYLGDVQLVVRQSDGTWAAAADQRGRGVAKVWEAPNGS